MSWTFVRPADPTVLAGRPLLDLGTGDGQTVRALAPTGLVVGVDRRIDLLRRGSVNAEATRLPFRGSTFETVLAADLVHHLDDEGLAAVLEEIGRVMTPSGRLVAWWYSETSDTSPDAPLHTRQREVFDAVARRAGFSVEPLEIVSTVEASPTVAVVATR